MTVRNPTEGTVARTATVKEKASMSKPVGHIPTIRR
jgi:hypothetical protein